MQKSLQRTDLFQSLMELIFAIMHAVSPTQKQNSPNHIVIRAVSFSAG